MCQDAGISGETLKQSRLSEPLPEDLETNAEEFLQPGATSVSHKQLIVEVKDIYAGQVMVEAKCIDIDERQRTATPQNDPSERTSLRDDQWQSLIALHKQLLHEHHDCFIASQHPSASPALSRLAVKYSMPARMWRHDIYAFLEVLRHRLPESLEHMLAFIYIAYSMMALLYETVPTFEDTWIECLGDLGRYRMAIEDDEPKDREVWSNVARFWYNKAADRNPNVGRLYHHLAILVRPYTLEQLSLYTRSLTCITPFESARGSIMTLFNPILNDKESATRRSFSLEIALIKAHGICFTKGRMNTSDWFDKAGDFLESYIIKVTARFKEIGVFGAVANIAAIFEYGIAKGIPKPNMASENTVIDDDERYLSSMAQSQMERLLWLCHRVAHVDYSSRVREYAAWMSKRLRRTQVASALWLDYQLASVCLPLPILKALLTGCQASQCIYHTEHSLGVREYVALISKTFRRKRLSRGSSLLVPFIASFLPATSASPIGNADKVNEPLSLARLVPLLAGSLYVGFAAAALAMAHALAPKKGPIRVWACLMGISAYGWWAVRNDITASSLLSMT